MPIPKRHLVIPLALAAALATLPAPTPASVAAVDAAEAARTLTATRVTAATVADEPYPLPAPPVRPRPCVPAKSAPGSKPAGRAKPAVRTKDLPAPLPLAPRQVDLAPVTGKGMWLTTWADTRLDVDRLLAQATDAGLRQLWVRTGGSRQGWYGTALLERLLPAAHDAGLAVIAWDFPFLSDPILDVARARRAIDGTFAGHRIDAFSPDIETRHEGTFPAKKRVRLYLSHLRKAAGNLPIVSTVMRPTPSQLRDYPYRAQVPYIDAFAPMVYWSCNEPGRLARESVQILGRWRPVHLVGQSYDMGPQGGPRGVPPKREIWRFLDVAKRSGAIGASLYNYDGARGPQWAALGRYPWTR